MGKRFWLRRNRRRSGGFPCELPVPALIDARLWLAGRWGTPSDVSRQSPN